MAERRSSLTKISARQLRQELRRRQGRVKGLIRRRAKLEAKIAAIEAQIGNLGGNGKLPRGGRANRGAAGKRPKNAMSLVEAITKALGSKSMSMAELVEAVQKTGYRSSSPNLRGMIAQRLINEKSRFKRMERGVYAAK